MRSQLVPLLQRTAGQAVGSAQPCSAAGTELQGSVRSLIASQSCMSLSAAAAAPAEAADEQQASVSASDAPADAAGLPAAAAQPDQHAASSTISSGGGGDQPSSGSSGKGARGGQQQPSKRAPADPATQEFLKDVGLYLEHPQLKQLDRASQDRLTRMRSLVPLLRQHPSSFMAAACINGQQLQTVVSPAVDTAPHVHPLEFAEDWVQQQHAKASKSSSSGSSSSSGGGGSKQPKQQAAGKAGAGNSNGSSSGSSSSGPTPQQQRRQQAAADTLARLQASGRSSLWDVQLRPQNLVGENPSELMVNLNVQMLNARAAGPDSRPDHRAVVALFDQLLDQGVAAALEQQGGQQQQEGAAAALLLPEQYRPDHTAFVTYCKSVGRLAEGLSKRMRELRALPPKQRLGDRWGRGAAEASQQERRLQLQVAQEQAKVLAQGIERVAQLWQPSRDSSGQGKMGVNLHIAKMAALRAAGRNKEALAYWEEVRPRLHPDILGAFWRLHFYATACALEAGDLERADRFALVFSDKVNGTGFRREDYVNVIGPLLAQVVDRLARARLWDQAVYWLQQLINHDPLRPVEPRSFLVMLQEAAAGGRMDLARVMLSALDDTLKLQGHPPYVYSEWQCMDLMAAASAANDVPFIELVWDRLCQDVARDARGNTDSAAKARRGGAGGAGRFLDSSSGVVQEISGEGGAAAAGDEAAGDADSSSGSSGASRRPSKAAYAAAVQAFVGCEAYGQAFEFLHSMGGLFGGQPACSVYQGVRCFPEALDSEAKIAAAFAQLKARKDAGQPITTPMLNVLTRAIARSSDTTTVGKVFNAYEPTWGLTPDVDTYNAVLEACEAQGKVGAVQGMLSLMASRGLAPDTVSWNLLLSTSIRAEDGRAVVSALNRMRETGIEPSTSLLEGALDLAFKVGDSKLKAVLKQVVASQLPPHHPLHRRVLGAWTPQGGNGGGARGRDVWKPDGRGGGGGRGRQRGEQQQQQQGEEAQQAASA